MGHAQLRRALDSPSPRQPWPRRWASAGSRGREDRRALAVAPLLHNGFQQALLTGAAVVLLAAVAALLMWISGRQPRVVSTDSGDVTGERIDDGMDGRVVFSPSPHQ